MVIGDNEPQALADIEASMNAKLPIAVLAGSALCNTICAQLNKRLDVPPANDSFHVGQSKSEVLERLVRYNKVVTSKDNSEDMASIVHLLLTISL